MTDELDEMIAADPLELRRELRQIALAFLRGEALDTRIGFLARRIWQDQALADLFARRALILELERMTGERVRGERAAPGEYAVTLGLHRLTYATPRAFAAWLPNVGFADAVRAVIRRFPVVAPGWEATRDAYEVGAFALARAATQNVTDYIQQTIARAIDSGTPIEVAEEAITAALAAERGERHEAGYIDAYADTVFRTNTTNAYAEGRIAQAKDPEIAPYIGAWRFEATRDSDVRPNHLAADGFIAAVNDPVWRELRPPLGYNCRCALTPVSRDEAIRRGVIDASGVVKPRPAPANAAPDRDFRNLDLAAL